MQDTSVSYIYHLKFSGSPILKGKKGLILITLCLISVFRILQLVIDIKSINEIFSSFSYQVFEICYVFYTTVSEVSLAACYSKISIQNKCY